MTLIGLVAATVLIGARLAAAQSFVPLPKELEVAFGDNMAEVIRPVQAAQSATLRGNVTFTNKASTGTGGTIDIEWFYSAEESAEAALLDQHLEVSFKPTAVCRQSGVNRSFFVAGWMERPGAVVIEKWTVDEFLLGEAANPSGKLISTMSAPRILREQILFAEGIGPVSCLACNPFGSELVILEASPTTRLYSLPTSGGELVNYQDLLASPLPDLSPFNSCDATWSIC